MNRNILKLLNERPIAYYPIYKRLMGSTAGGVVLSQLMYWFAKKDKFHKTDKEIMQETEVGVGELKSAKKQLKSLDFIQITLEGLPAKTYFEIDWELYEHSLVKLTKQDNQELPSTVSHCNQAITKTTTKKEREGNFYEQHKNGIMLFIDESIKQEKNIKSTQGYKKSLIHKFITEDAATIETYAQWTKEYGVNQLIREFQGKKYKCVVNNIEDLYILEDIEYNSFEFVPILRKYNSKNIAKLRMPFETFNEMKDYIVNKWVNDAN